MKLTAFTDYSLRVLIYLGADPGRRATISAIAESFAISENHLVKVVHLLGKGGWLATVRGKGGGISLAMPPEAINLGAVVRATEGRSLPAECFSIDGGRCVITGDCRLQRVFGEAVEAFYAVLERHTLADLVRNRRKLRTILTIDPG